MRIISSGIDRGPSDIAIVGPEVRPQAAQIDKTVDLAKQMIVGDMPLNAEAVEQRLLHPPAVRPSSAESPLTERRESATGVPTKRTFSTSSNGRELFHLGR
jgi:hypothetical protein